MTFLNEDFLLNSDSARVLYHDFAKDMPIYDYHCHLSPKDIAEDRKFQNITELWLEGDHYKWRAMRSFGIEERYITGQGDPKEKFHAWIKTLPYTIGNPLHHWSHLELKRFFHYDKAVTEQDWELLWAQCNSIVQSASFSAQNIIRNCHVKVICTTDDPTDSLHYHRQIAKDEKIATKVLPTFRPDRGLEITKPTFQSFVQTLEKVTERPIPTYSQFLQSMELRIYYFHEAGCRLSDHGFEGLLYEEASVEEVSAIFDKAIHGGTLSRQEEAKYKTVTMQFLFGLYHQLGWTMQLHIGALRNNNTRMFEQVGADSGFDSMYDFELAKPLNALLDSLERKQSLPKTIIYTLNPVHNELIASTIGNFQSSEAKGKIQFGSGWWYNDQKAGMLKQMTDLANAGLLSTFVGMLTDSRSLLSYTRHEYFRRILCQLMGGWMDGGEVPKDYEFVGKIIQDISYYNAKNYFAIDVD